jgi:phosphatidate cytidylyltransferase
LIGKRKLNPKISPKKTIEGSIGGLIITTFIILFLIKWSQFNSTINWVIITVVTSLTGTIGDLIQSKIKRLCNVKDSGTILPGHGGIYDRIDSLIFAAPIFLILIKIFGYVS